MVPKSSELEFIADVQKRLGAKYPGLAPDYVASVVRDAHARFERSAIRDFVPVLVEKQARDALTRASRLALCS